MGIWNAHTSVGNIVGTIVPSFWANPTYSHPNPPWGLSFIVPSLIMAGAAMLVFALLVVGEQCTFLLLNLLHEFIVSFLCVCATSSKQCCSMSVDLHNILTSFSIPSPPPLHFQFPFLVYPLHSTFCTTTTSRSSTCWPESTSP